MIVYWAVVFTNKCVCVIWIILYLCLLPKSLNIFICCRIVYREVKEEEGSGLEVGGESTPVITLYSRGSRDAGTLSSTTSPSTPIPGTPSMSCTVEDVLQFLRHLYVISTFRDDSQNTEGKDCKWSNALFAHSEKLGWYTKIILRNIIHF